MLTIKPLYKYVALAVGFLLIGIFIAPRSDKDLERQFEKERDKLKAENRRLTQEISERVRVIQDIRVKMTVDSVKNLKRLEASNAEINRLKIKIRNVNFQNADTRTLDSIRGVLYGSKSLPESN